MRATTAQVKARRSSAGPNASGAVNPCVGWVRMAEKADRAPAMAHARDDMRDAKMPDMRAASGLAAALRKANPKGL